MWKLNAPLKKWMRKTYYLSFILPDQQENPKGWYTPAEAIWCILPIHLPTYFNMNPVRSTSVRPTLAGLPGTAISYTARCAMELPPLCSKGFLLIRMRPDFGRSLINIKLISYIRHRRQFVH